MLSVVGKGVGGVGGGKLQVDWSWSVFLQVWSFCQWVLIVLLRKWTTLRR